MENSRCTEQQWINERGTGCRYFPHIHSLKTRSSEHVRPQKDRQRHNRSLSARPMYGFLRRGLQTEEPSMRLVLAAAQTPCLTPAASAQDCLGSFPRAESCWQQPECSLGPAGAHRQIYRQRQNHEAARPSQVCMSNSCVGSSRSTGLSETAGPARTDGRGAPPVKWGPEKVAAPAADASV